MEKLKVAIDTSFMDRRPAMGTAVFIRMLVEHLRPYKDQLDITLVHREPIPEDPLYKEFKEIVIPRLPFPRYAGILSEFFFFLRHWRKFDVYHFGHYRLLPTYLFAPARRKMTMQYDGGTQASSGIQQRIIPSWYERFFFERVSWFFYRKVFSMFIATSEAGKEGLKKYRHIPEKKIAVLYGGVDKMFSVQGTRDARHRLGEELAKKYGTPASFIIASGRLDPHKNILRLVEAYSILNKKYDIHIPLIATGGAHMPDYSERVFARIKELGLEEKFRIFKVPDFSDMPRFYAAAECMIFPSLSEGFGLPLVEAFACGTPTIAAHATSLIEVGGDATYFVDPLDVENMAAGMAAVLKSEELQRDLIRKGFEQAKKFTWEHHAEGFVKLIRAL